VKRLIIATAVFLAAVAVFVARFLPPAQIRLADTPPDGSVPGVVHVHTARSDGRGTLDEVAAAAARAGLKFVVFTDHGDATRKPDPPTYRSGVLCLDGVEVSTSGGHYVVLDMPASPYPLGGEARDVVEDVRRLGGFGIAAHPDSPKPELSWREWTAPFDGIEIVNPDTSWRQWLAAPSWRPKMRLAEALMAYPVRPAQSIASLIQPSRIRYQWQALAARRRVVMIGGTDAHAKLEVRPTEAGERDIALPLPSYVASFRTLSVRLRPDGPLTGDAAADASVVVRAIRAGHFYTVIDAAAGPPSFDFAGTNAQASVHAGDQLLTRGPLTLHVRSNAPRGFMTTVWNGAVPLAADRTEQEFSVEAPEGPGAYWVEIRATDRVPPLPWITSNAIYVRAADAPAKLPGRPPATQAMPLFADRLTPTWHVEHDTASLAAVDAVATTSGSELRVRFGLGGGTPAGQYAALATDLPTGVGRGDRLTFTARAEHPLRLSVQLRTATHRWQRSVYVDRFDQVRTVFFDDMMPIGATDTFKPPLPEIGSILFVVDLTNAKPGTSGRFWISQPALQW